MLTAAEIAAESSVRLHDLTKPGALATLEARRSAFAALCERENRQARRALPENDPATFARAAKIFPVRRA